MTKGRKEWSWRASRIRAPPLGLSWAEVVGNGTFSPTGSLGVSKFFGRVSDPKKVMKGCKRASPCGLQTLQSDGFQLWFSSHWPVGGGTQGWGSLEGRKEGIVLSLKEGCFLVLHLRGGSGEHLQVAL